MKSQTPLKTSTAPAAAKPEESKRVTKPSSTTKILACTCKHVFQDKEYGPGMRLHNWAPKSGGAGWRCTVCADKKRI